LLIMLFVIVSVNLIQADGIQENKVRSVDLYKLMSRLDLDRPELETVRRSYGNPSITAVQLMNFFRSRTSVKHPAGKFSASEMRGKVATEDEIKMADNFKVKARKALDDARVAAHAVLDDVSVAAHNTLVNTEADVQKVSDEVKVGVHKAVADAKIAAHKAETTLKKK